MRGRKTLDFSMDWNYSDRFSERMLEPGFDDGEFESVCLPHANRMLPFDYFSPADYQFVSCYRKSFDLTEEETEGRVFLNFEGIMTCGTLFVNGIFAGEHRGGYTEFLCEITAFVRPGQNVAAVKVDSTERPDIPPFGGVIDYLTYGGIYREAQLILTPRTRIAEVVCRSADPLNARDLTVSVGIDGSVGEPEAASEKTLPGGSGQRCSESGERVFGRLLDGDRVLAEAEAVSDRTEAVLSFGSTGTELWQLDRPKLYTVEVRTEQDLVSTRFGFRSAEFRDGGFFLNGKRLVLRGLNRHQSYAYAGYAMPKNAQVLDAEQLKFELALNVVRTSHYPQSRHFLDRCDEIGLLVMEEIPGWQHIGDEAWKALAVENVEGMVRRDRNRPSVILWSIRINESDDDHEFYLRTNAASRSLDPTRPTIGVRWQPHSECLEDVHGMNDFMPVEAEDCIRPQTLLTGLDRERSYLVTEYMGHMYPTKSFDNEDRLVRHALRHAEILDHFAGASDKAGGIGWCAYDYNTHREFGTNDKVCYHGVCDMFRNPKYAAFAYSSQNDPAVRTVLEPATIWAFGEKNIGGVLPLVVFSNCDRVVMRMDGQPEAEIPKDVEHFGHLEHPPFVLREMPGFIWGATWRDAVFEGWIGGKIAVRKKLLCSPTPDRLDVRLSNESIPQNDVLMVRVRAADAEGNVLRFLHESLSLSAENAKIVGDASPVLQGGVYAFYLRTRRLGPGSVTVSSRRFGARTFAFEVTQQSGISEKSAVPEQKNANRSEVTE